MKKIIFILLFVIAIYDRPIAQNQVDSNISRLTQITTDLMHSNNNGTFNWGARIGPGHGCPDNVSGNGGGGGFWNWLGNFFSNLGDFFGDILDAIGGFFGHLGSGGPSGSPGGGPIGPPAGPSHGPSGEGPNGTSGNTNGGINSSGGPSPTPIVIIPPTEPATDNDLNNECSGMFTTFKTFVVQSDTCPSGKSINKYKITMDCFGNTFTNLISSECFQCDNLANGYNDTTTISSIYNYHFAYNNSNYISLPSSDDVKKWASLTSHRLSAKQISVVDTLRKKGASEISIGDINKIKQKNDSATQYVNFDEYAVNIDTLPIIASKRQTPSQLLEYIRLNFLKFQDTAYQKIIPYNNQNDSLWKNSRRFKTTSAGVVLKILRPNGINGVAVATYIRTNDTLLHKFIITNVTDPNLNGRRKFNTNREFGYTVNQDSSYTFYCRTIDRTSKESNFLNKIVNDTLIDTDNGVGEYFQESLGKFVNDNQGSAPIAITENLQANENDIKNVIRRAVNLCDLANGNHTKDTTKIKNVPCPTDTNFTVTAAMLRSINNNGTSGSRDSVARFLTSYMNHPTIPFKINTRLRLAHFLAQIITETDGFRIRAEQYNKTDYPKTKLMKKSKFRKFSNYEHIIDSVVGTEKIFNYLYANDNFNEGPETGDGANHRGHGLSQLTWKEEYIKFNKWYHQNFTTNFAVITPDMIANNMFYSVISALWDITINKDLNTWADKDDVEKYSKGLNLGSPNAKGTPNNLVGRINTLNKIKKILCL